MHSLTAFKTRFELMWLRIISFIRHLFYPECNCNAIITDSRRIDFKFLKLGSGVFIFDGARIEGISHYAGKKYSPKILIEDDVKVQRFFHCTCGESITIGKSTSITHNVTITDIDHTFEYPPDHNLSPIKNPLIVTPIKIGNGCLIFPNTVILGGTILGDNCVVAANSTVRGIFPDNCLIGGSPAKL